MRWLNSLCSLFLALGFFPDRLAAKTVWIDTDVSIGSPIREADDAFALVVAFHSPELRIVGVSTTYGNTSLAYVDRTAREITQRFGQCANLSASDVRAGASSPRDLGARSAAVAALAAAIGKHRLTYIALGPLTNLASALQLHPQIRDRIDQIIFVGGVASPGETRFGPENWLRIHDANVYKDTAAVDVVLQSGIPILLLPIAVAGKLTLDQQELDRLRADGPAAKYLAQKSVWWSAFWIDIVRSQGAPVFDALAVMAAAKPELLRTEYRDAYLNHDRELIATRARPHRVRYCRSFQSRTKALFRERLIAR